MLISVLDLASRHFAQDCDLRETGTNVVVQICGDPNSQPFHCQQLCHVCSAEIPSEPKPQCRNVLQRVILGVHVRLSADPNRCTLLPNDLFGRG
jgi:hypothetical protein